jgi:hypothetical protein
MRRIGLIALVLVSVTALSGAMTSTAMAKTCVRVEIPHTGSWADSLCTKAQAAGEYVKIQHLVTYLGLGQWCAEVEQNEKGTYKDPECNEESAAGRYIRVHPYQHWQKNGELLAQGTKLPIKLQLKGVAVLSAPSVPFKVECNSSISEGSTLESQGKDHSDQGKGRLVFTSCKTSIKECKVAEPIMTVPTKAHLGLSEKTTQGKIVRPVVVFTPTAESKVFTELKFPTTGCGVFEGKEPVDGDVAAEIAPEGAEVNEGLLNFPETPIKEVYNEQGKEKLELALGGIESIFSAAYGARLESGEAFGVGG